MAQRIVVFTVGVALLSALPPFLAWLNLEIGQPFSLLSQHNGTDNPSSFHSRFRRKEYPPDLHFFQWWNFLIYDAETHDHWSIGYSMVDFPPFSRYQDVATVGMAHLRESEHILTAGSRVPLDFLKMSNDFDFELFGGNAEESESKNIPPRQFMRVLDDNTYHLYAIFQPNQTRPHQSGPVEWNLTVYRVHGYYGSHDQEEQAKQFGSITSTLFSYNSQVSGWIKDADGKVYEFNQTKRFRCYSAGSWGRLMPSGSIPINYPWSWFWLVLPNEDFNFDIGMCSGLGRFQSGFPLGDVEGGYAAIGLAKDHYSARYVKAWHNTTMEFNLLASSSDSYLRKFSVDRDEWTKYTDDMGSAIIPLRQKFHFETKTMEFTVDFHSKVEQYFRIPGVHQTDEAVSVFSDFRAVGARAHVVIKRRVPNSDSLLDQSELETILDTWTNTMNAVEYAYASEVDLKKLEELGLMMVPSE